MYEGWGFLSFYFASPPSSGRKHGRSAPAHAQFVSNVVDYHMNIQAALEQARFTVSEKLGCNIVIESRVPVDVRQQLSAFGHVLDVRNAYSTSMGRGQAVLNDTANHVHYGASDPRADGSAEPEGPATR